MNTQLKNLEKSQVELTVEFSVGEFAPYIKKGAEDIAAGLDIKGFRPGKAPYEMVKQKVGEMAILENAANLVINEKFNDIVLKELPDKELVGQPRVEITKLAPGNPLEIKIIITLLPPITLGAYKELKIKKENLKLDEKEIERTLEMLRASRAKEVAAAREAREGDKAVVSVEMFLDKVPVEGGQAQEVAVILGKDYFIPGFDKKIAGLKADEAREFELPYPTDFYQKNLAGKLVEFRVKMKSVFERQLPELTDEFAKNFGAHSLENLKENIKKGIEAEKEREEKKKDEIKVINKIIEKTKFGDIPEDLLGHEGEKMFFELEQSLKSQGGNLNDYLSSVKKTKEQLLLEMLPEAMKRVKAALVIREIARLEKISVSEKEVEKKQEEILAIYKDNAEIAKKIKEESYKNYLKNMLANELVLKNLLEWNLEK